MVLIFINLHFAIYRNMISSQTTPAMYREFLNTNIYKYPIYNIKYPQVSLLLPIRNKLFDMKQNCWGAASKRIRKLYSNQKLCLGTVFSVNCLYI